MTELEENNLSAGAAFPGQLVWSERCALLYIAPCCLPNTWDENGMLLSSLNIMPRQVAGRKSQ